VPLFLRWFSKMRGALCVIILFNNINYVNIIVYRRLDLSNHQEKR